MNVDPNKKKIIEEYSVHNNVTKIIIIVMIVKEKKSEQNNEKEHEKLWHFFSNDSRPYNILYKVGNTKAHTYRDTFILRDQTI